MGNFRKPSSSSTWGDESRSFLTGDNAPYIARIYESYLENPSTVSIDWRHFFSSLGESEAQVLKDLLGPSWRKQPIEIKEKAPFQEKVAGEKVQEAILDSIRAIMLIRAYRARGHMIAHLDPLELPKKNHYPELDPKTYGGTIGIEFLHIQDPDKKLWLQKRIEGEGELGLAEPIHDPLRQKKILKDLIRAEAFEEFLHVKYPVAKRFGLDGAESLIPCLEEILQRSSELGVEEVVIGMAHRGRLNVLANVLNKPYRTIFSEFQGYSSQPDQVQGSGDVKYHLGTSMDREFEGKKIHLSLTANPSHLEAVDPVVVGKVRAKQTQYNDKKRKKVMGLLLHGDAAFVGQGLVAETFMLSQLHGYQTGGTFHIIINNQIGFTTAPAFARSRAHCSDLGMIVQAPIFHVNGDDPEAVIKVMNLAAEYRHTFGSDIVVDMRSEE